MSIFLKRLARAAAVTAVVAAFSVNAGSLSDRVDSLATTVDNLEDKVRSTLMSGGSSPISFAGEARIKAQYHNLGLDAPAYMQADRSYLQSGWEGNENLFRLGMVVRPGRNTVLWSKIGFQHTLIGNYYYGPNSNLGDAPDGFSPYQYRNDKVRNSVTIHEDMSAGIAVRTIPASFWVRFGNTMWTEASPLTVWKAQPRTFAWEYLPFEVEQPIARYYEYNIAKGEKSGRAAWNKKPFNGLNIESINLPLDLYANFVYGTFERFDNFEREYIDFGGDLGYADGDGAAFPHKSHGVGDSYRHIIHGRLAKGKVFRGTTLGLNYVGVDYNDDVLRATKVDGGAAVPLLLREFRGYDSVFYKEPKVFSVDWRGAINDDFSIHADLAFSRVDTVWRIDTVSNRRTDYESRSKHPEWYEHKEVASGDFIPAFFLKLNYNKILPTELDIAYISKGFYSPFSFVAPVDAFYAFGSNMLGAGKFIARGEGSPYTQNMMGANVTFNPQLKGYGHLRLKYGQHMNITDDGQDLLFFPYRLHGADMFSFFHSSFNRWGNGLVDNSVKPEGGSRFYAARLGDESFTPMASYNVNEGGRPIAGPGAGGLRSDFLAMFEGFVPYRDSVSAWLNWRSRHRGEYFGANDNLDMLSTINNTNRAIFYKTEDQWEYEYEYEFNWDTGQMEQRVVDSTLAAAGVHYGNTSTSWVPASKKYTFNLELDAAYDIGRYVGYKRDLFVGGYVGINGVTTNSMSPLTFSETGKNTLLWSAYLRLEPAIAITKNFYLLGLFGYENWRSDKSWMMVSRGSYTPEGADAPVSVVTGILNPTTYSGNAGPQNFVRVPIDYLDLAYGLGFDWDMLQRVGLHARVKWMTHEDRGLNKMVDKWLKEGKGKGRDGADLFDGTFRDKTGVSWPITNDWSTWVMSLELKTWF